VIQEVGRTGQCGFLAVEQPLRVEERVVPEFMEETGDVRVEEDQHVEAGPSAACDGVAAQNAVKVHALPDGSVRAADLEHRPGRAPFPPQDRESAFAAVDVGERPGHAAATLNPPAARIGRGHLAGKPVVADGE
jgi:hypothetical protein